MWPHFAFAKGWGILGFACSSDTGCMHLSSVSSEFIVVLVWLWVEWLVYMLLAYYLDSVLPKEFGVRKKWHFPATDLLGLFCKNQTKQIHDVELVDSQVFASSRFGSKLDEDIKSTVSFHIFLFSSFPHTFFPENI